MAKKTLLPTTQSSNTLELTSKISNLEAQLADRTKILEYLASLLLAINTKISSTPALQSAKFNFFWLVTNWRVALDFVQFTLAKIEEFVKNIKFQTDAPAQ